MKFVTSLTTGLLIWTGFALPAYSISPDVYVVNFRNAKDANSARLDSGLSTALAISGVNAEEVVIDTTTAAKWEKGAHEAFDRDIVPVFNQWVGLTGFAVVVDAKSKRVIGCVNSTFSANEMAEKIRQMASRADGSAYLSKASLEHDIYGLNGGFEKDSNQSYIIKATINTKTTNCPAPHNVDPSLR